MSAEITGQNSGAALRTCLTGSSQSFFGSWTVKRLALHSLFLARGPGPNRWLIKPNCSKNKHMPQLGVPKCWLIKESIKHVAKEFIEPYPEFEEFILSYCKEIDSLSPKNARSRLRTLFNELDQIQGSDAKKEFLRRKIAEKAAKSESDGKKICIRAVIDRYRASYIPFAMKNFLDKYLDGTLTYEQAFQGEEVPQKKFKKRFIVALNQGFATAHPWEANLKETHRFGQDGQLRDLRFCDLLLKFRKEHPDGHSQRGHSVLPCEGAC